LTLFFNLIKTKWKIQVIMFLHSTSTLAEPIISYDNLLLNKSNILKENEDKGGINMWSNKLTKEKYVGRSINLFF